MIDPYEKELVPYLEQFVRHRRRQRMEEVLANRTRRVTIMLEDVYQPHNASAVLRTCECLGVQDVHVVEANNSYHINRDVSLGAGQWLTVRRYPDTLQCVTSLRAAGYRLVAATPHRADCDLDQLPCTPPVAVMLGTEEAGLSPSALEVADLRVRVPIYGFTESYNVSVCAALMLGDITKKLRRSGTAAVWGLSDSERHALRLAWYRASLRGVDQIEARFRRERQAASSGPSPPAGSRQAG